VPADLLLVIFTSGSTAAAKGVVHTHGTVVRKVATGQDATGFPSDDGLRVFAGLPFFWIGGIQTTMGALCSGATLVCQERFDPDEALDLIAAEDVGFVMLWPTLRQRLERHAERTGRALPSTAFLGLRQLDVTPDGAVRTNLGMTETMGPHATGPATEHRIVDREGRPTDGRGEIAVRGYTVMQGLYKREREETFDPEGWYHTGDEGVLIDGALYFHGRASEMIKTNGANVAPAEVEQVLAAAGGVRAAFVFGLPDDERGEIVVAAVVPDAGAVVDEAALRANARGQLSAFKVPRAVVVLAEDEVPLTRTGKADKRQLRADVAVRLGVEL
jgi:acyl-CoA synthetase (AMP-forming)/AMP-acid ligase II